MRQRRPYETLFNLTRDHGISGVPVVDGDELVGIITSRDVRFEQRTGVSVRDIMTPRERLVTAQEGTDFSRSASCCTSIESKKCCLLMLKASSLAWSP